MELSEDDCVFYSKDFSYAKNLKAAYIDTPTQAVKMFFATGAGAAFGILTGGPGFGTVCTALSAWVTAFALRTPSKPLYLVIMHELTMEEKRELGSVVKKFFHNESAYVKCQNLENGSVSVTLSSKIVEHGLIVALEKFFKEKKNLTIY